ncbi:MAG: caspase family protein [Thermodesulfobacteriota bacterium]
MKIITVYSLWLVLFFSSCVTAPPAQSDLSSREGKGLKSFPDGSTYEGFLKDGRLEGSGIYTWPDGSTHEGLFKADQAEGRGTRTAHSGMKYIGEFKEWVLNGQATCIWPDGTRCVGEFKGWELNGQATCVWPDGIKYVGDFSQGKPLTPGEYIFPNGSKQAGKLTFSALILGLAKDSQGERMGLRKGDIIFEYNDIPITTGPSALVHLVSTTRPEDKVALKVYRDRKESRFTLNGGAIGIEVIHYPGIPPAVSGSTALAATPGPRPPEAPFAKIAGQSWAVIIGISDYKDTRIPSLRYASRDANSFYEWITSPHGGKYSPAMVKLLLNRDATGENIKNALFVWLKQALQEDLVTIYFAGHGSPESPDSPGNLFLLPYDAKYDEIATSGFPMWDIETALKRFIKAKKVVVIADACHSGGVGQSYDVARRDSRSVQVNPISSGIQNLSQIGDGVCVISASDDKQYSQESQDWGGGHGVFTYFLLEGLKGNGDYNKDQRVTLGELIPYISEQVRRATNNAQSPTVAGKFDPSLGIGR